jgi:hypothetical protein
MSRFAIPTRDAAPAASQLPDKATPMPEHRGF